MSSASFEAKLIYNRTLWDVVRVTCGPLLVALALMAVAAGLEAVAPAMASMVSLLGTLCMFAGIAFIAFAWRRGPSVTVADGVLAIGTHKRAPLRELETRVGQLVMAWRAGYSRGVSWMPLLTLRFPDRTEVRIACQGAGGPAEGRDPTEPPHYHLEKPQWDRLVALLGPPSSP